MSGRNAGRQRRQTDRSPVRCCVFVVRGHPPQPDNATGSIPNSSLLRVSSRAATTQEARPSVPVSSVLNRPYGAAIDPHPDHRKEGHPIAT